MFQAGFLTQGIDMVMWLRLGGALLATLVAIGLLERLGVGTYLVGRTPSEVQDAAHDRPREIFWFMIFAVVMATSLLAAARRGGEHLRRAVSRRR
jgi:hypothetical protein